MRRTVRLGAALLLFAACLSGCSVLPMQTMTCVDWVWFETPRDAAEDSDAVVIGQVVGSTGTVDRYGHASHVWTVEVSEWVEGSGADTIEVVSQPRTCETGSPYPDGDPLDTEAEVMLFLRQQDDASAETVTGLQGVIPAPDAGAVPDTWPAGSTP
ncbi:hypothetical protein [Microbacterium sulfonylureivorans]|uniref:hypothetical protein n=1 Tax=Microbacterium sulfonylureivorans TaxID=2486854 RepID=UPI000FDB431F|nr:hypothetical protein [Microbacterium sulfonylureivorans]